MSHDSPQAVQAEAGPAQGLTMDALKKLLRSEPASLDAYFGKIGASASAATTKTTVHCHHLKLDGHGKPRVKGLADRLARELVNYSIPRSEIDQAKKNDGDVDTKHSVALYRKANRLFTDLEKTGEGGELLLYLMVETYLGLPQILCKMPLKTSSEMHFHGSDGIYGAYDEGSDCLAIYWGESKLYSNPSDAIGACFKSLAPFVIPDGSSMAPQARDLQLLKDNIDLTSPKLESALLRYLDPDDTKFLKLNYRGVALVGFDSDSYANGGLPVSESNLVAALASSVESWKRSTAYHVNKNQILQVEIELFCIPFPSVEEFREAFLKELGIK